MSSKTTIMICFYFVKIFWLEYYREGNDCMIIKSTISTLKCQPSIVCTLKKKNVFLRYFWELELHTELFIWNDITSTIYIVLDICSSFYSMPFKCILSTKWFWLEGMKYWFSPKWTAINTCSQNSVTEKLLVNSFFIPFCWLHKPSSKLSLMKKNCCIMFHSHNNTIEIPLIQEK